MNQSVMLILGAGHAGCALAFALRDRGWDGRIVLVSDEAVFPYHRPPLSKAALASELMADQLAMRPASAYADSAIELRLNERAVSLDPVRQTVRLATGEELHYHRLAIATGSRARTLPSDSFPSVGGVLTLRSFADAVLLRQELQRSKRLVVIGGGYVGLEVAATARSFGVGVSVLEMAPRLLPRVASAPLAEHIQSLHEAHDVNIRLGAGVERLLTADGRVVGVQLADGSCLDCDTVLLGVGGIANDAIAEAAGLDVENGIVVDEAARTSVETIVAIGDCANIPFRGRRLRLESVQNANDQARIAAATMMGESASYEPVPWFWSDQYKTKVQIAGLAFECDRIVPRPGVRDGARSFWLFNGQCLQAVESVDDAKSHVQARKCLQAAVQPDPLRLGDVQYQPV